MRFLLVIFLLVFNLLAAEIIPESQKPKIAVESISKHAIRFGEGTSSKIYVFIDPLCKYSRELIKKIYENKMLLLSNSYYVYLYRLPRLDSEKTMQYIYESADPKSTLIDIMVDEDFIDFKNFQPKESTVKALKEIADVAATLDMTQRPYMISFDKDSKYCRVSEGTASCLEELE